MGWSVEETEANQMHVSRGTVIGNRLTVEHNSRFGKCGHREENCSFLQPLVLRQNCYQFSLANARQPSDTMLLHAAGLPFLTS